jgi:excisionase family DNA binding protein
MKYNRDTDMAPQGHQHSTGKLLLRVEDVMSQLSLSRPTVYHMIAAGELPSIRIGRAIRVPVASLEDWLRLREGRLPSGEADDHLEADR